MATSVEIVMRRTMARRGMRFGLRGIRDGRPRCGACHKKVDTRHTAVVTAGRAVARVTKELTRNTPLAVVTVANGHDAVWELVRKGT